MDASSRPGRTLLRNHTDAGKMGVRDDTAYCPLYCRIASETDDLHRIKRGIEGLRDKQLIAYSYNR